MEFITEPAMTGLKEWKEMDDKMKHPPTHFQAYLVQPIFEGGYPSVLRFGHNFWIHEDVYHVNICSPNTLKNLGNR